MFLFCCLLFFLFQYRYEVRHEHEIPIIVINIMIAGTKVLIKFPWIHTRKCCTASIRQTTTTIIIHRPYDQPANQLVNISKWFYPISLMWWIGDKEIFIINIKNWEGKWKITLEFRHSYVAHLSKILFLRKHFFSSLLSVRFPHTISITQWVERCLGKGTKLLGKVWLRVYGEKEGVTEMSEGSRT